MEVENDSALYEVLLKPRKQQHDGERIVGRPFSATQATEPITRVVVTRKMNEGGGKMRHHPETASCH